ncbi:MAG TPA: F0F1 ATP synthase subunit A [Candidatus Dormibacteraeota bacterium]|jgi:F-type H+-transporting ATPase subunit a|nr:F0F1 ATP synthase subunit A [Candidatus Dormibacteraeota bacterium]
MNILAAEAPSGHEAVSLCGSSFCNINYQTLLSSAIAIVITILVGLYVAHTLQSGRPSKLQMVFELFLDYVRGLVGDTVSREGTDFIIPLAATIGFYVLVANWLDFLPLTNPVEPAASDVNQTAALGILVFLAAQAYSVKVLGVKGSLRRFTKPFEMPMFVRILFIPLNIIEELVKPVTLSLRLFGNIFAGVVMVFLLGQLYGAGAAALSHVFFGVFGVLLLIAWKFFDVFFVGTIQAFIFMLLTVIYFGQAREGLEEEEHHGAAHSQPKAA